MNWKACWWHLSTQFTGPTKFRTVSQVKHLTICVLRAVNRSAAKQVNRTQYDMCCLADIGKLHIQRGTEAAEMKKERWARVESGYCNASKWKRKWIQWQFNGPFVSVNSIHKTTCCRELTVSDKWNMVGVQWGNGRARWWQLYQFHSQCTTGMMRYDTMTFTFHIYQFHSFFLVSANACLRFAFFLSAFAVAGNHSSSGKRPLSAYRSRLIVTTRRSV